MTWYTYVLRCADGSLYTGISTDLPRRLAQHRAGIAAGGAKYTAARSPLGYECAFSCPDRATASRLEYRLKKLNRAQKLALIAGELPLPEDLAACQRTHIDSGGQHSGKAQPLK